MQCLQAITMLEPMNKLRMNTPGMRMNSSDCSGMKRFSRSGLIKFLSPCRLSARKALGQM